MAFVIRELSSDGECSEPPTPPPPMMRTKAQSENIQEPPSMKLGVLDRTKSAPFSLPTIYGSKLPAELPSPSAGFTESDDPDGCTDERFCRAVMRNDLDLVRTLLREGCNPDTPKIEYRVKSGFTQQYYDILPSVLKPHVMRMSINVTGPVIHYPAEYGMLNMVRTLVEAGASLKRKNINGRTPLMTARHLHPSVFLFGLTFHNREHRQTAVVEYLESLIPNE